MTRSEIIETMARAMCENIFPNCDARPREGSPWVSTWERERDAFSEQATAALSALEAAGLAVVPNTPVAYMRRWAFDRVDVMKLKKKDRPAGWELHEVTKVKIVEDDLPLFLAAAAHGAHKP